MMELEAVLQTFPDVTPDTRPGYEGYIVPADFILSLFSRLRDDCGYDYLSSVTGVDYLPEDKMEVVYHLRKLAGGSPMVLKVQTERSDPHVPSLTSLYIGANFQEREAWDLLGIKFDGHPNLERILLWDGFNGHPLRKDWKEPFYEQETKPYKSRWPDGNYVRAEERNPFGDNVNYPEGFDPTQPHPKIDLGLDAHFEHFCA